MRNEETWKSVKRPKCNGNYRLAQKVASRNTVWFIPFDCAIVYTCRIKEVFFDNFPVRIAMLALNVIGYIFLYLVSAFFDCYKSFSLIYK